MALDAKHRAMAIDYAKEVFEREGITYELKNPSNGHFHCYRKSDGRLVQYWATTGTIFIAHSHYGDSEKGLHSLLKYLNREV